MFPFVPQAPNYALNWDEISQSYPWVQEMQGVPQDPVFHAEGDVWIHTRMVLESLIASKNWQQSPEVDQGWIFWACLLHDVAKSYTTQTDIHGRIRAPKHAMKGALRSRAILWKGIPQAVPFPLREKIVQAVRFHGLPLWYWEKSDRRLIEASLSLPLSTLAMIAEADVRGRICEDQAELLEKISFFRAYAEEMGIYQSTYPFASDLARFHYFHKQTNTPSYNPYDDSWGEVILMSGLPGSGKDHWIQHQGPSLPVISLDAIREELRIAPHKNQGPVIQLARDRAKTYLRKKQPFIWNATNISRLIRTQLIDLFVSYKAKVRIVYVEVPWQQVLKQNQDRQAIVPQAVMDKLIQKWEVPGQQEAQTVDYYVQTS